MKQSNKISFKRILKWEMKKRKLVEKLEEARSAGDKDRVELLAKLIETTENKISEIKGSEASA